MTIAQQVFNEGKAEGWAEGKAEGKATLEIVRSIMATCALKPEVALANAGIPKEDWGRYLPHLA